MSLPPSFLNPEQYFEEALKLFNEHQMLFKHPNTQIFTKNVLDEINLEGFEYIDVFDENLEIKAQNNQIEALTSKIGRLKVDYCLENVLEEYKMHAPLGEKKKHEIMYLAKEIQALCAGVGCDTVVDFGSGLGYLDQLIFDTCKYKVLGLECETQHYVAAKTRQRKYHEASSGHVKYIKHKVRENSSEFIQEIVKEKFGRRPFCMTGLHACADLTVSALNLFFKMADAKAIILMSCCYHRMVKNVESSFVNFPLSDCFKKIFKMLNGRSYLNVAFLRLAAQPPRPSDGLKDLVFNLIARATLEFYADTHNCTITRKKRKAVNLKKTNLDFESYAENAANGFTLSCKHCTKNLEEACKCKIEIDLVELKNIWTHFSADSIKKKAAVFILLQRLLQPVCENLVLYDRIVYLQERGVASCSVKKIVDETISPRCLAIIACK